MAKRFGSDISKIFRELQMMPIAEMAYHQMIDRSDFVKQKVKFINDEGEEAFHEIGGIKLFFSMIQGMNEKITIVQALMATIGISRPMMEKMVEGSEEKKSPLVQPTTPKSSTPLATNTDGQQSTSSVEPSEK